MYAQFTFNMLNSFTGPNVLIKIFQLASGAISYTLTVQIEICQKESNYKFESSVADFILE
jgi:hypothetical protein